MAKVSRQLAEQTAASEEISHVVQALEQHYDSEMEEYRERNPSAMMPGEAQVPSGEEISEAFENFLAAIEDRDRDQAGSQELPLADEQQRLKDHYFLDPTADDDQSASPEATSDGTSENPTDDDE